MKNEVHESVTATELVRNLSGVIDRVRMSGQSLYITKGTQTVAELRPPPKAGYPINRLPGLLNALPELGEEVTGMADDLERIKKTAAVPDSAWD